MIDAHFCLESLIYSVSQACTSLKAIPTQISSPDELSCNNLHTPESHKHRDMQDISKPGGQQLQETLIQACR